jgi:hypothetical protein
VFERHADAKVRRERERRDHLRTPNRLADECSDIIDLYNVRLALETAALRLYVRHRGVDRRAARRSSRR